MINISNSIAVKPDKNFKNHESLKFFHFQGQKNVHCKECLLFPEIIKLNSTSKRPPPITTQNGTKYLVKIVKEHLESKAHKECHTAYLQSKLNTSEILTTTPIGKTLSQANLTVANQIGRLMYHVYCSAKKLTLSAMTFPARVVVGTVAENFEFDKFELKEHSHNFKYVTPAAHKQFLESIVQCHRESLASQLLSSLAMSLRCDGSVDRLQVDKVYNMIKSISKNGSEEMYFLGAFEPVERGATGLLGAVKEGCSNTIGESSIDVFKGISSFVTDGTIVNTGEKSGLWKIFEDYVKSLNPETNQPLLKIWCSAHR